MKNEINKTRQLIIENVDRVSWGEREVYASFLAQTYHYVSHSTRLLALSASRLPLKAQKPFNRFVEHIREEKNHEILAERDLSSIGYSLEDFLELESTQAFYRLQYYYLQNQSPWSIMGYILTLESLAVDRGAVVAAKVQESFGKNCASFLKLHADEDVGHLDEALNQISSLDERDQNAVLESMRTSRYLYAKILQDLPQAFNSKRSARDQKSA